MFSGTHKEYQIAEHVQTEMRAEADQARLAQSAPAESHGISMAPASRFHLNRAMKVAVAAITILVLLIVGQQAFAQGPADPQLRVWEDGIPESDPILAYKEGRYLLMHGEYELAVEKLTEAIEGVPETVFQLPGYADWFWLLGEAQEGAGLYAEALVSYQTFLDLMGEWAAPWTFEKVETLSLTVNALTEADES